MNFEVHVRHACLGVTAIAHVAEKLPSLDEVTESESRREPPTRGIRSVVGSGSVIVQVVIPILPALAISEHNTPPGRRMVEDEMCDRAVGCGNQWLESNTHDVDTDMKVGRDR
jgi:hypothetical protein